MMDSHTDLFDDSSAQDHPFASVLNSEDLPAIQTQARAVSLSPSFRPPEFPLIHQLLLPGGSSQRNGGQINSHLSVHRHLRDQSLENERDDRVEHRMKGVQEQVMEEEDSLLRVKKRHNDTLAAEWSQDFIKVKRMKLESQQGKKAEEGAKRYEGGREGRRKEREELKEQLEEARERLQALQEKVWRAFGEKHLAAEQRKGGGSEGHARRKAEVEIMAEDDIPEGIYDEEDIDGEETEKESFSLLPVPAFDNFRKQKEEPEKGREESIERGRRGGLALDGVIEGSELWLDCGSILRDDWDGVIEEEGMEGGQKFAQALKLELGSAVARVIDRVLRIYTEMTDFSPPPSTAISFVPSDPGNDKRKESGRVWIGLSSRQEEARRDKEDNAGVQDKTGEKQKLTNGFAPVSGPQHRSDSLDLSMPLTVQRSPDTQKSYQLLGPPLSSHQSLPQHQPSLPRPPVSHSSLLSLASQPKDPSTSSPSFHPSSTSASSSSSSFPAHPPLPPPLPLPLLHYSMQQLFSRSLHSQLPHLPPSRKDYLNSDLFLEFSSHPSFPPLPLFSHLDPSLTRHANIGQDRERGMRGEGGIRGMGGLDGDLYLSAGGSQEGLSPCHLKKAKLMFFYTRYPSSNTLKTYFPDVKFNRCVTSQMIKWFSNFREFFYIQMERFARQAVREALTRDGAARLGRENQLRVSRDTELYRILNMHYNKSNIYQVPERFIEVSEVALREFYSAIWTGRDSDPCWKKGIYKIICKLDCPLPDAFRLPGCPVG
ncbi:prospero homeobox 3 [Gouania willdenowi]|uniref:prospero homeobox 3 n=1 Tax=Gouania willdenowi TaxID=441366 RepID=UPI0010568842|nr:prospero homeobox protein 2-like [Gouania willdenowi]XP_028330289.1 prospero homeobox protein 2-like [Gouania willdenowi]